MAETVQMWSPSNPYLQVVWDSTSMGAMLFCPTYYLRTIVEGWQDGSNDLEFGGFYASAMELYQKMRLNGWSKKIAQLAVVRRTLEATWNEDGTQWGGRFETQWRCTGTEPYKNAKGNRAKCPYSHKGVWMPEPAPEGHVCGECGSEVHIQRNYIGVNANKNRQTLLRTIIWYIEEQPEDLDDGLRPYRFPDGTAAVELSFKLPLPWTSPYGDQYLLAGHGDYIGTFGGETWWVDQKTTTKTLNAKFWGGYSPHFQMDTYDLVGVTLYPELEIQGVMVDAAQTLVGGSNFARRTFRKTEAQRAEHMGMIRWVLVQAETYAEKAYQYETNGIVPPIEAFPMNKRNCWLCPFREVCDASPEKRERILAENFTKRAQKWDPTIER